MISIIIPIYKAEEFLEECLISIQNQTYKNFEVICVNDGSPDNSEAICKRFVAVDNRFKLINQENKGVSAARNTGLAYAHGEYICFVDADDKIHGDYLRKLKDLKGNGILPVCSFSSVDKCLGNGKKIKRYNAQDYILHIFNEDIPHPNLWAMLFESKIIKNNRIEFVVGCIKNEDTEFFVKYISNINEVIVSDYKGYFYRINPNSCMNANFDVRSFTSIDAQERMAKYLLEKRLIDDGDIVLGASVQVYAYSTAKRKCKDLYEIIHQRYNVRYYMKKMLKHPRFRRKGVSICYLLFGKGNFYRLLAKQL